MSERDRDRQTGLQRAKRKINTLNELVEGKVI